MQKNEANTVQDSRDERDVKDVKEVPIGANRAGRRLGLIEVIVAAVTYLAAQVICAIALLKARSKR